MQGNNEYDDTQAVPEAPVAAVARNSTPPQRNHREQPDFREGEAKIFTA